MNQMDILESGQVEKKKESSLLTWEFPLDITHSKLGLNGIHNYSMQLTRVSSEKEQDVLQSLSNSFNS